MEAGPRTLLAEARSSVLSASFPRRALSEAGQPMPRAVIALGGNRWPVRHLAFKIFAQDVVCGTMRIGASKRRMRLAGVRLLETTISRRAYAPGWQREGCKNAV